MEHFVWFGNGRGNGSRCTQLGLDPCHYVREADRALADGNHDLAVALVSQAYLAFDLCAASCEHARAWDKVSSGKRS